MRSGWARMGLCVSLAHCPNVDLLCGSYGSQLTGGLKRMIKRRASVCVCQCQSLVTIGETSVLATASCHCASGSCMIMCAQLALGTTTSSLGLVSSSGLPEWVIFSSDFPSSGTCSLQVPTVGFERCLLLSSLLRVTPLPTEHDVMCDGLSQ